MNQAQRWLETAVTGTRGITMTTETKKTQTIEAALEYLESQGFEIEGDGEEARIIEPQSSGAHATLDGGYSDANYSDYVRAVSVSQKRGGVSGRFFAEIEAALESHRESL